MNRYRVVIKLGLIGVSAALSLSLGWIFPTESRALLWYVLRSYYVLVGAFLLWLLAMLPKRWDLPWAAILKRHLPALALAAALVLCFFLISEPKYRIFNDEVHLGGVSFSMYHGRSIYVTEEAVYILGDYEVVSQYLGKRPLLFPFLVSLVHTVSGYRADNAFVVNLVATWLCLFLFHLLLSLWFSPFWSRLGMVLLASFPLLINYSMSGGFEVVNLLFILLAFWLFHRFMEDRDVRDLERLGLTLVMLAQIRYESPAYFLCFGLVLVAFLRSADYRALTYRSVVLPLLFLPVLWQRRIFSGPDLFAVDEDIPLFSLSRVPANLVHAWEFFMGREHWYGTVPPVFLLALAGGLVGVYHVWRRRGDLPTPLRAFLILLAVCLSVQSLLVLAFYWGDLRMPQASRYGVVFLPLLGGSAVFFLAWLRARLGFSRNYAVVLVAGLLILYWPFGVDPATSSFGTPFREYQTNLAYLKEHYPDPENLIIFDTPLWYLVQGWGSVSGVYANENKGWLLRYLRERRIPEILVVQTIDYEGDEPSEDSVYLDPEFRLEPMFEAQVSEDGFTRISRVRP